MVWDTCATNHGPTARKPVSTKGVSRFFREYFQDKAGLSRLGKNTTLSRTGETETLSRTGESVSLSRTGESVSLSRPGDTPSWAPGVREPREDTGT